MFNRCHPSSFLLNNKKITRTSLTASSSIAHTIRDVNLLEAKKLLRKQSRQLTTTHDDHRPRNYFTLKAALEIKQGKPKLAARTFTKLLNEHPFVSDDPVFLANLSVVLILNGEYSKSQIVLKMIPQDHPVWKEQAEIWLQDAEQHQHENTSSRKKEITSSCRGYKTEEQSSSDLTPEEREEEEKMILYLKKEIAECLREKEERKKDEAIERLKKLKDNLLQREDSWVKRSKAVQHLKQRVESALCYFMRLKNAAL